VNTPAEKVDFTGVRWGSVEWTLLVTLYLRACESRLERPILGDTAAAEAVEKIDYNWSRMRLGAGPWSNQFLVALRAKQLDVWTADFLKRHPDSVVLHLGCGMDTRAFRLERPATVQWFDVDQPHVVELRRRLYSDGAGYRMIGSSVTDPQWLDSIPADRPAAVVAEGLLPYLTVADVQDLLRRITARFPGGELSADLLSQWAPRVSRLFEWGVRDGRELQAWNPRLRFIEQISALGGYDKIPAAPQRALFRLFHALPITRDYDRLYRFEF
jgi:O-methyltransferase involved in polyketide biosynthesis